MNKSLLAQCITQGPAKIDNSEDDVPYLPIKILVGKHHKVCQLYQDDAPVPDYNAEQQANAELIVEAFNVTHETGRTPR